MGWQRSPWWLPWALYGPLGAFGAAIAWLHRGAVITAPMVPGVERLSHEDSHALGLGLAIALALTAATLLATRLLVRGTRWARSLHTSLRSSLLGASNLRLLALASASALAEELFFRAALVPAFGMYASALLFGILHASPRGTYVAWMIWATLMGVAFGALFLTSGSLLPPLLAHALINFGNMHFVCKYDPQA